MKKQTGSFTAKAEDGTDHVLHIFTTILDAGTRGDPGAELEGLKELRTEDGQAVNRLDKGKYQIDGTDEILVSDDPDAP